MINSKVIPQKYKLTINNYFINMATLNGKIKSKRNLRRA